jgi:H/ACA ribonucleoprotein complex subunit 4
LGLRKTSHFGTLDPKVTGVLPIALNRACKLTGFFIGHDKEYVGIMRMHEDIELDKIEAMIKNKFLGVIKQTPPVKSRVKRQEREREVKVFELLEKNGKDILFRVVCQGGTYIRKLCDDLGRELGIGAHMLELRRTRAGVFEECESMTLYGLDDEKKIKASIISGEEALKKIFPVVQVREESVERLLTGKPIMKGDVTLGKINNKFIVFCGDKFIGVYENEKPLFVYQEIRN